PGIQTNSDTHQGNRSPDSIQAGGCQTEKGVLKWVTPGEALLSTEFRAFPRVAATAATRGLRLRHPAQCRLVDGLRDSRPEECPGEGHPRPLVIRSDLPLPDGCTD